MYLSLPASMHHAAVQVALVTRNMVGIDDQLILDTDAWEDVPIGLGVPAPEVEVAPSHEGGEYVQFIDMVQASFSRYVFRLHSFVHSYSLFTVSSSVLTTSTNLTP